MDSNKKPTVLKQSQAKDNNKGLTKVPDNTFKDKPLYNIKKILKIAEKLKIDVKEKLQPPQIAWQLKNLKSSGYGTLGTLGNFSLVIGKAKSRKSFFINIAVSAATKQDLILGRYNSDLPKNQQMVVYFDTEQGKYHVQLALKRICRQTKIDKPKNLQVYHLRALEPRKRLEVIEAVIYNNANIGFVVIDGIRDLVTSINDEEQATNVSSKLLKWTEEKDIHIVTVLHQNKSDNNARGHLGTELMNKSEIVLSVTKQKGNEDISIVQPEQCRNKEPETFAFQIIDGLPVLVENYVEMAVPKRHSHKLLGLKDQEKHKLLKDVFSVSDSFMHGKLKKQIKLSHDKLFNENMGNNDITKFISESKSIGWLIQKRERTPYRIGILEEGA